MIALACDHGGFELMQKVKAYFDMSGVGYKDFGTYSEESCDYPDMALSAAGAIARGECSKGIFICGTGAGMAITANKVRGIRAVPCSDCFMAEMIRRHNDANVLTLGARVTGADLAIKIIDQFLTTGFDGGRHARRVEMINAIDEEKQRGKICT